MAKDPYRYFRIEAQELLEHLGQGLLALEKGADEELVRRLLRHAHTFKGASRVVRQTEIAELAHELEDLLSPHRDGGTVARDVIDRAFERVDAIRRHVEALGSDAGDRAPAGTDHPPPEPPRGDDHHAIRIPIRELDVLLETAFEAHAAASLLRADAAALGARGRARLDRVIAEIDELASVASDLRLVPAATVVADVERAVRDTARALDKDVEVSSSGVDTRLDAHVLAVLRKALVHVVSNSVAHGIETRSERTRAGKPAVGRIEVAIERRGHRAIVRCRDDGRGLDLTSVRRVAVERGVVDHDTAASMDAVAIAELLLRGGVSTSRTVTGVSGRGVGLDAVRAAVEALKGEVTLHTAAGEGTTVEIVVPISLSSMPTLSMHVGDTAVLVPLDSVRRAVRVAAEEISSDGTGERLVVDGDVLPFLPLRRALGRPEHERPAMMSAVIVQSAGRLAAVGVDRLGAAQSVVVRAVPEHAAADPVVAGASLDEAGAPQLVLAPPALVAAASVAGPRRDEPREVSRPPLLVIDDSLTTRMLEQSILESAGYEVDLAVSAEDGLHKAGRRRYGLFIVDVEMPGMNGFEFIAAVRRDAELRDTPSILVTSRADPEDKRRGKDVGARAYIVKSEFDQGELLETIRRLVG